MTAGSNWARRLTWLIALLVLGLFGYALVVLVSGAAAVPGQSAAEQRVGDYADVNRDVGRGIIAFLTVDYERIDELTAEVRTHATGAFAKDYAANEVNLKAAATQAKAQTTGEVKSIGISEIDENTAVAYVAADSVVSNNTTTKIKKTKACPHDGKVCRFYRFKLTMTKTGTKTGDTGAAEWKISQLEFVS